MADSAREFSAPQRKGTKVSRNDNGDLVQEADGDVGIRTHDFTDEDEINQKLFGKTAITPQRQSTNKFQDADGNTVEEANASNIVVRTHDHSDEAETNRKLFGDGAVQEKTMSRTNTYRDAEGNLVTEAADSQNTGIRVHDQSDQDEINARLFGQGAKNAD